MATDDEMSKTLRVAKILQIVFLGAILIYVIILVVLPYIGFAPIFPSDYPLLTPIAGILGVHAVISIALGYLMPRRIVKRTKQEVRSPFCTEVVLRCAFFEAVAIDGGILGVIGAGWEITIPFFIVGAGAMILTFPTEERWRQMIEQVKTY